MNRKKIFLLCASALFLLLVSRPAIANGDPKPLVDIESLETEDDFKQAYNILKDHVKELKATKRAATTETEKELVKNQIQQTKNEIEAVKAKALSGGIYIGSGALLLIILLLLIL